MSSLDLLTFWWYFLPAAVLSLALTPLARRVALGANLVAPVRADRLHAEVRPYGGGMAIFLALAVGLPVAGLSFEVADGPFNFDPPLFLRLGVGAIIFFIIGLLDDRYALRATAKLLLQVLAAAVVVLGLGIKATAWMAAPGLPEVLSIIWILAVVNAYNMLDHADGLAAAVGMIAMAALAIGQIVAVDGLAGEFPGTHFAPLAAAATAGALAGFLIHNFPPARLFMGDAGSSLVGYLMAAITMACQYHFPGIGPTPLVVLVPVVILAIPLFDLMCVTVGRIRRRQSPLQGDATSHLAHRMLSRGWDPRGIVCFASLMALLTGTASILLYDVWDNGALGIPSCEFLTLASMVAGALTLLLLARRRSRPTAPPHAEEPS